MVHGRDAYAPESIDYALSFRPPPGLLKTLPKLEAPCYRWAQASMVSWPIRSFPGHVPLVRFVDDTLRQEMAQYIVMHVLLHHRGNACSMWRNATHQWQQISLPRRTEDTRVGILGLGEIGTVAGKHLVALGFAVSGWSRSEKQVEG